MRIVAIGGTRFIGRATVRRLLALGHEVMLVNRGQTSDDLPEGVTMITSDKSALAEHRAAFTAFMPDVVLHNMVITDADVRVIHDTFTDIARRFVMISSIDVYLPFNQLYRTEGGDLIDYPITEESPLRSVWYPYRAFLKDETDPRWFYDKIPAEQLTLASVALPGTVLRLPMVYGERDYARRLTPYLKPMIDGRPAMVMSSDAAAWRSTYGYIDNVAEGITRAILDDRASGRVYNLGESTPPLLEWVTRVKATLGWQGEIVTAPNADLPEALRDDQDLRVHLAASDARIRAELDYVPLVTTDEAIRRTVAWERETLNPDTDYAAQLAYAAQDTFLTERT